MVTLPKDCVAEAVAKGVDRDKAKAIRDHILAGGTREEWLARSDQLKAEAKRQADFEEKRAAFAVAARVRIQQRVKAAEDAGFDTIIGLQSILVGTNRVFEGHRNSAEAAILGFKAQIFSRFERDLGDDWRSFASREHERNWIKELAELNDKTGKGNSGITADPVALRIAQAVKRLQDSERDIQNRFGAEIGALNRRIARTEHDPDRLDKLGLEGWKKLVYETADIAGTFGPGRSAAEIDNALDEMYRRLHAGEFGDTDAPEDAFIPRGANIAKKVSASRVLQFPDAGRWYAYQLKAARSTVTERIVLDAIKGARNAGLLSVLGPNPEDTFARVLAMLKRREGLTRKQITGISAAENRLKGWLQLMTGTSPVNKIGNKGVALAVQNWMTVQRTAKLGFLPFAQIADLATAMSELRYQGVDFLPRTLGPMRGYFKGKSSNQKQVARLIGAGIDGWIAEINHRMDATAHLEMFDPEARGGPVTGALSKLQHWMFKYTGAQIMTDRAREANGYVMARHWGDQRGKAWGSLNAAERRIMSAYELGEPEWKALNSAEWTDVRGDLYMTPHVVQAIPEARLREWKESINRHNLTDDQAREELATRVWRYYSDRERYALLVPGIQERSWLTGNLPPDELSGITWRLMAQFKSFFVGQIVRTWSREIHGVGGYGAIGGLIQFGIAATVLGTVSQMMRDIVQNIDPFEKFDANPAEYLASGMVRGGAAGPFTDFLFGEFNRHGQRFTGYFAGPTGSLIDDVLTTKTQAVAGKPALPSLLYAARNNLPLQNVFWTKAAFDAFVWSELMEYVQPGYSSRIKRRQRREGIRPILGR